MGEHDDHSGDITSTFGRKVEAVSAHVSQSGKHPDLEGFLRARRVGEARGIALAEGFKRLAPG